MCVLLSLLFLPSPLISSRTAMGDRPDHLGNFSDKNTYMVGIPLSPSTLYVDHPNDNRLAVFQNDLGNRKRSNTSFQITSVTVQGSRTNTEDFEDSADDFEESHTDDISSDILDSSKFTEPDGYHSEDNTNPNIDDLSPCGPMIITPLTPVTNESTGINVGIGIDMSSPFPAIGQSLVNSGVTMMTSSLGSPVSAQVPIMSPLPDNWQHRFKVVKIVSSEPFKRGRWLCMDFKDPPTAENSGQGSLPAIHVTPSSFNINGGSNEQLNVPNAVAHVFEIPVSSAYAEAVPPYHQPMQQIYGILLPQSNNNNNDNPTTVMGNLPIITDVNFNKIINENASQLCSHSHPILFQTSKTSFTPGSSIVTFAPTLISNGATQMNNQDVNGHDNISHQVLLDNGVCSEVDQSTNNAIVIPESTSARSNTLTEDTESRFCSLANQLSRTSGLSQSPPTVPPSSLQNIIPNGEYVGRPRTPSLPMTRESPMIVCATPPTAAPVAKTSSVATELPNSAASSGASTVAIDNKIEQAMDLVKSHLMFAVREEVEVLKEKITELLDRISQLEHENDILRANASPETLKQLNQSQKKFTVQQTGNQHIQNQPPSS